MTDDTFPQFGQAAGPRFKVAKCDFEIVAHGSREGEFFNLTFYLKNKNPTSSTEMGFIQISKP